MVCLTLLMILILLKKCGCHYHHGYCVCDGFLVSLQFCPGSLSLLPLQFFCCCHVFFFCTVVVVFSDVCLLHTVFSGVLVSVDVVCFLVCKEQGVLCFLFGV